MLYKDPAGRYVYHLYMIQLSEDHPVRKSDFMWELYTRRGIKAWSHYMLIHITEPYRARGHHEEECPTAEEVVTKHITLPIHPRLTFEAIDYMADCIIDLSRKQ